MDVYFCDVCAYECPDPASWEQHHRVAHPQPYAVGPPPSGVMTKEHVDDIDQNTETADDEEDETAEENDSTEKDENGGFADEGKNDKVAEEDESDISADENSDDDVVEIPREEDSDDDTVKVQPEEDFDEPFENCDEDRIAGCTAVSEDDEEAELQFEERASSDDEDVVESPTFAEADEVERASVERSMKVNRDESGDKGRKFPGVPTTERSGRVLNGPHERGRKKRTSNQQASATTSGGSGENDPGPSTSSLPSYSPINPVPAPRENQTWKKIVRRSTIKSKVSWEQPLRLRRNSSESFDVDELKFTWNVTRRNSQLQDGPDFYRLGKLNSAARGPNSTAGTPVLVNSGSITTPNVSSQRQVGPGSVNAGKRACEESGESFERPSQLDDHKRALHPKKTGRKPATTADRVVPAEANQLPPANDELVPAQPPVPVVSETRVLNDRVVRVQCPVCLSWVVKLELVEHIRTKHPKPPPEKSGEVAGVIYTCEKPGCGRTFKKLTLFRNHVGSHGNRNPRPCAFCSVEFFDKDALIGHLYDHIARLPQEGPQSIDGTTGPSTQGEISMVTHGIDGDGPSNGVEGGAPSNGVEGERPSNGVEGEAPSSGAENERPVNVSVNGGKKPGFACSKCNKQFSSNGNRMRHEEKVCRARSSDRDRRSGLDFDRTRPASAGPRGVSVQEPMTSTVEDGQSQPVLNGEQPEVDPDVVCGKCNRAFASRSSRLRHEKDSCRADVVVGGGGSPRKRRTSCMSAIDVPPVSEITSPEELLEQGIVRCRYCTSYFRADRVAEHEKLHWINNFRFNVEDPTAVIVLQQPGRSRPGSNLDEPRVEEPDQDVQRVEGVENAATTPSLQKASRKSQKVNCGDCGKELADKRYLAKHKNSKQCNPLTTQAEATAETEQLPCVEAGAVVTAVQQGIGQQVQEPVPDVQPTESEPVPAAAAPVPPSRRKAPRKSEKMNCDERGEQLANKRYLLKQKNSKQCRLPSTQAQAVAETVQLPHVDDAAAQIAVQPADEQRTEEPVVDVQPVEADTATAAPRPPSRQRTRRLSEKINCDKCGKELSDKRYLSKHKNSKQCRLPSTQAQAVAETVQLPHVDDATAQITVQPADEQRTEEPVVDVQPVEAVTATAAPRPPSRQRTRRLSEKMNCDVCGKELSDKRYLSKHQNSKQCRPRPPSAQAEAVVGTVQVAPERSQTPTGRPDTPTGPAETPVVAGRAFRRKVISCDFCTEGFASADLLKEHVESKACIKEPEEEIPAEERLKSTVGRPGTPVVGPRPSVEIVTCYVCWKGFVGAERCKAHLDAGECVPIEDVERSPDPDNTWNPDIAAAFLEKLQSRRRPSRRSKSPAGSRSASVTKRVKCGQCGEDFASAQLCHEHAEAECRGESTAMEVDQSPPEPQENSNQRPEAPAARPKTPVSAQRASGKSVKCDRCDQEFSSSAQCKKHKKSGGCGQTPVAVQPEQPAISNQPSKIQKRRSGQTKTPVKAAAVEEVGREEPPSEQRRGAGTEGQSESDRGVVTGDGEAGLPSEPTRTPKRLSRAPKKLENYVCEERVKNQPSQSAGRKGISESVPTGPGQAPTPRPSTENPTVGAVALIGKPQKTATPKSVKPASNPPLAVGNREPTEMVDPVSGRFQCVKCRKSFKTAPNLSEHIKKFHHETFDFCCERCKVGFHNAEKKNSHAATCDHVPDWVVRFDCVPCGKDYATVSGMRTHLARQHRSYFEGMPPKVILARKGAFKFPDDFVVGRALLEVPKGSRKTPGSPRGSKRKLSALNDSLTEQSEQPEEDRGERALSAPPEGGNNVSTARDSENYPWACDLCDKRYRRKEGLTNHKRKNHVAVATLNPPTAAENPAADPVVENAEADPATDNSTGDSGMDSSSENVENRPPPSTCGSAASRKSVILYKCLHCPFVGTDHMSRKHRKDHPEVPSGKAMRVAVGEGSDEPPTKKQKTSSTSQAATPMIAPKTARTPSLARAAVPTTAPAPQPAHEGFTVICRLCSAMIAATAVMEHMTEQHGEQIPAPVKKRKSPEPLKTGLRHVGGAQRLYRIGVDGRYLQMKMPEGDFPPMDCPVCAETQQNKYDLHMHMGRSHSLELDIRTGKVRAIKEIPSERRGNAEPPVPQPVEPASLQVQPSNDAAPEEVGAEDEVVGAEDEVVVPEEAAADEVVVPEEAAVPEELPVQVEAAVPEELPVQVEAAVPEELPVQVEAAVPEELPAPVQDAVPEELPTLVEVAVPEVTPAPVEVAAPVKASTRSKGKSKKSLARKRPPASSPAPSVASASLSMPTVTPSPKLPAKRKRSESGPSRSPKKVKAPPAAAVENVDSDFVPPDAIPGPTPSTSIAPASGQQAEPVVPRTPVRTDSKFRKDVPPKCHVCGKLVANAHNVLRHVNEVHKLNMSMAQLMKILVAQAAKTGDSAVEVAVAVAGPSAPKKPKKSGATSPKKPRKSKKPSAEAEINSASIETEPSQEGTDPAVENGALANTDVVNPEPSTEERSDEEMVNGDAFLDSAAIPPEREAVFAHVPPPSKAPGKVRVKQVVSVADEVARMRGNAMAAVLGHSKKKRPTKPAKKQEDVVEYDAASSRGNQAKIRFTCPECAISRKIPPFNDAAELRAHVQSSHPGRKFVDCQTCGCVFANTDAARRHKARHHPHEMPYQCRKCNVGFMLVQRFELHVHGVHPNDVEELMRGVDQQQKPPKAAKKSTKKPKVVRKSVQKLSESEEDSNSDEDDAPGGLPDDFPDVLQSALCLD